MCTLTFLFITDNAYGHKNFSCYYSPIILAATESEKIFPMEMEMKKLHYGDG
jgi:hypothetical protein